MTAVFRSLLRPGVLLMRRLRLSWQMSLIGSMLFATILVLTVAHAHADLRDMADTLAEVERAHAVRDALQAPAEGRSSTLLMDMAADRMPPWMQALAMLRDHGASLLARADAVNANADISQRALVLGRADELRRMLDDVQRRGGALEHAGEARLPGFDGAIAQSRAFAEKVAAQFGAPTLAGDPAAHFALGNAVIAAVESLGGQINSRLLQALQARAAAQQRQLFLSGAIIASGMLLLAYCAAAFYLGFVGAVVRLNLGVAAVADGNLAHRFDIDGRDELADTGSVVERMADRLSTMVAEIRSSAVRVSDTGAALARDSAALALRTDEQAGSLREFVATVQQMSGAVAANACEVQQLDGITAALHSRAADGNGAMAQTIASLADLEDGSRRVSEVIGVIDGIAFQTNILALNAAVEAARAGASGSGFAVVASEVRSLAKRSADAAGEIRRIITRSREQVEGTVARVQTTGNTLRAVVDGVRDVSGRLRDIARSSQEQRQGLEEMAAAVRNLDEITRQNAAMVDESQSSAQALVARAKTLEAAVGSMRLRQGSADEAHALVCRALSLVAQVGREAASAALHSGDEGFVDRDLYIFLIDRDGRYRLHGAKREMEGKRVHEVPGIDGDRFVRDAWAAAAAGGQWIDYDIVHPVTGKVLPKASWVQALDKDLIIGCGIYRQQEAAAAAPLAGARPQQQPTRARPRTVAA